jgi:hypothetical protein
MLPSFTDLLQHSHLPKQRQLDKEEMVAFDRPLEHRLDLGMPLGIQDEVPPPILDTLLQECLVLVRLECT